MIDAPKYSAIEVERRWLVDLSRVPELSSLPCREIEDLYIAASRRVIGRSTPEGAGVSRNFATASGWLVAVALAGAQGACTSPANRVHQPVPASWPPLVKDCAAIGGTYRWVGEQAYPSYKYAMPPTLFSMFRLPSARDHASVRVEVNADFTALSMVAYGGSHSENRRTLPVRCVDGFIRYEQRMQGGGDGQWVDITRIVTLAPASDGSIVAHLAGSGRTGDLFFRKDVDVDVYYLFTREK